MTDIIEKIPLKGDKTLIIVPDDNPFNPREDFSNVGIMAFFHRRYTLGDKTDIDPGNFSSWQEIKDHIINDKKAVIIYPVYMIDHSGLSIRVRNFSDIDPGNWDSGQIGFIYTTKDQIRKEYSKKRITKKIIENIKEILLSEVRIYDQYLQGESYGYMVRDRHDDIIDSCYGFYEIEDIKAEFNDQILQEC